MANDFNNFNYDGDDQELDENGLPIYSDDEEDNGDTSSQDLMDMIRRARGEDEEEDEEKDDKGEDEDSNSSNHDENTKDNKPTDEGEGGRYGDNPPQQKQDFNGKSPTQLTQPTQGGDSNWFSKLTGNKMPGGTGKVAGQAGKEAGKQAAKQAGHAAVKAGGQAISSALAAAAPYIGIALLIIFVIILVVVIIMSIVAFFQSKTNPENLANNEYITSEYFYGIRVSYIDEEAIANSLQLSYKQYAVDILEDIETDNPEVTINITLPENTFDNTTQVNQHITNISLAMGNIVATGSSNYSGVEFATIEPQIEYFGLTAEQGSIVSNFITQYIIDNNLITVPDGSDTNTIITTSIQSPKLQYIYNLCEKVMIKDEIATENGLSSIEQRKYVGCIYMPNKDIVITTSVHTIVNENEDCQTSIVITEENNGTKNILNEKIINDNVDIISGIEGGEVNLKAFTSIDNENPDAFSEGLSLFEAIKSHPDYFAKDTETGVYTWKPVGTRLYYLAFASTQKFIFSDFHFEIELP